jgi:hypothetical protein
VLNYATRGREGAIYERAILLGLGALEGMHAWGSTLYIHTFGWFVTLYYNIF